jgi:hypothetical protein
MNSIHRVGLTIAGLTTTVLVAGVFVAQGYVSAQPEAQATAQATATPTPDPTATLEPQTIYIDPVPTPSVISVVQTPPPTKQKPPVVRVVVPPAGGDDEEENDD